MSELSNAPQTPDKEEKGLVFLMRYLQVLFIHKWIFVSVFVVVFAGIVLFALKQPKVYNAQYEVFYNETIREYMDESDVPVVKSDFDKNFWLSNMLSGEIARMTVLHSGLSYSQEEMRRLIAVEMADKKREDRVPIYKVTVSSTRPNEIPLIIKAYLQALNELLLKHQVSNSERFIGFLTDQLNDNNGKLSGIDNELIGNSSKESGEIFDATQITSDLESFRTKLLNSQINLATVKASKGRTEQALKNLDGTIVNESAFSEPLKVQLMNLEVDLARALTRNKEDHPSVKAIRNNIKQLNVMLRDSLEQRMEIKSLVQNPLKIQLMGKLMDLQITEVSEETQVLSLQKVIADLERMTLPDTTDGVHQQLLRNREMVYMSIKQLNSKLIEAQSTARGNLSRFVTIDEASTPVKAATKGLSFFILVAFVLATAMGAGAVFVYDMLDNRLMVQSDFERFYALPVLGTLPRIKRKGESDWLTERPGDKGYEGWAELSSVAVGVRQAMKYTDKRLIAVCSSLRQEGKSLISWQLARTLADKNVRVLLVDMDFFAPKITAKLDKKEAIGLSNFLAGECTVEQLLLDSPLTNLTFTGVGTAEGRQDLYYDHPALGEFITRVRGLYDVVIFDTPAALYIPDIFNFMDLMEGVIVIARLRLTTRNALDKLLKMNTAHNTKVLGVVINDVQTSVLNKYGENYYYSDRYYTEIPEKKIKKLGVKVAVTLAILVVCVAAGYLSFRSNKAKAVGLELPPSSTIAAALPVADKLVVQPGKDSLVTAVPTVAVAVAAPDSNSNSDSEWLDTVVIEPGTRLTLLAQKYYGNKVFWVYIYMANNEVITNPNQVAVGTKVRIPAPVMYGINAADNTSVKEATAYQSKILAGDWTPVAMN
nr:AAA family ATPase [uncultured Macellibacteroides sp.]